ncbi:MULTISPECIES: exodeoxyribonuclease V subunit gamma [unclassified Oceanobacter]|uniref:exodeoxyribonuclease V subunit gamma n=1 Tax=unclassified Oceanobacter TaxID=2620260 RepID=UPI002734E8A6|nr:MULTISPECIES: exodeoxyribonuclease V subunit gamma [unclassified Oceanobacter]MDP2609622.1 exodeoxyribonuclease V subunit gamma [Oceanobacter sp. 1_MG-2023]MDP2612705.1 exodeoxyribonuclease V subunit gamma [Oceanobacter sp. 2_MG-2023]
MLKLYHSNDLDVLKGILLSLMQQNPPSPFEREAILVQSQGMAHWLKLNIADGLGVSAQLEFPLPFSFVWQIFNRLRPDLPERSHFDKQLMIWKLMRLLPGLVAGAGDDHPCKAIAHYLDDDEAGIKCYQLAQTIADVFDQYLVYRPDWLLAWEAGEDQVEGADVSRHPWQPLVWRALVADCEQQGQSLAHRARLMEQLADLVRRYPERLAGLPKRLFVFGIAALPGSYWQVLDAISSEVEVHFFLLNPCRNFWGDIVDDRRRLRILQRQPESAAYLDRGNPLLASWGQLGRDFLTLVHETELALDVEAWVDPDQPSDTMDLLHALQYDILELQDRQQAAFGADALQHSRFKQVVQADDDSLKLVSAHSPLREVQRLHDQLLHWFAQDPELNPRDVVVMVPDIDAYAAYIDAVFASVEQTDSGHSLRIPWAIADQSMLMENPLIETFLSLLGLADSRLTITEVQDWLDVAAIRTRFGIARSELEIIKDWLVRANIRWGLDGQQRGRLGLPVFEQNSWRKGLRQLLLGLMIPEVLPDSQYTPGWQGDWPITAVEGNSAELLGKLLGFVDALEYWQQTLGELRDPADWLVSLPVMLESFFCTDFNRADGVSLAEQQQQAGSLQQVRDALVRWQQELELSAVVCPAAAAGTVPGTHDATTSPLMLSGRVVRAWFNEQLGQQGGWQRFLAGPVNFCTLMPMRSIPFKVVCLLGMNDVDYPRRVPPVGFDLLASGQRRLGDRSRRDDDRYLFLEAVTSAQQHLYISYRGHGVRENNEQQPSVLVSELVDYVCDSFCLQQDQDKPHAQSREAMYQWLIETIPLQPFGAGVYMPLGHDRSAPAVITNRITSYHPLWAKVAGSHHPALLPQEREAVGDFVSRVLPLPEELLPQHSGERVIIELADMIKALHNNADFFLKRRLRANLTPYWQDHPAEEPFDLDSLERYLYRSDELDSLLGDNPAANPLVDEQGNAARQRRLERMQALGQLPVNALGQLTAQKLQASVRPLTEAVCLIRDTAIATSADSCDAEGISRQALVAAVELSGDSLARVLKETLADDRVTAGTALAWQLEGELGQCAGSVLIRYRPGAIRGKHLLAAWLELVLARQVHGDAITHALVLGLDSKQQVVQHRLDAPALQQANDILTACVAFYLQGWCQPQPLLPDLLWQLLQVEEEARDDVVAKATAQEFGELAAVSIVRCFPQLAEQLEQPEQRTAWLKQFDWLMKPLCAHHSMAEEGS